MTQVLGEFFHQVLGHLDSPAEVFLSRFLAVSESGEKSAELAVSLYQGDSGARFERGLGFQFLKHGEGLAEALFRLDKLAEATLNRRQAPVSPGRLPADNGVVALFLKELLVEFQCVLQQLPADALH